MSAGTSWRTASPESVCCYRCKRYLPPEKTEKNRCLNEKSCARAAVAGNRPRKRSKKRAECRQ